MAVVTIVPVSKATVVAAITVAATLSLSISGAAHAGDNTQSRAPGDPTVIESPHHGAVLFDFYQSKFFSATTGSLVSQHFDRLRPHDDEAEVLRGGMLLGYGLHRKAEAIFTRLAERTVAPAVRDRAWFFLAKLRFQRGLDDAARTALERVGSALPDELAEDRALLDAQLLMARGDNAQAATALRTLVDSATAGPGSGSNAAPKVHATGPHEGPSVGPSARPSKGSSAGPSAYLRFNLGVALVRAGDTTAGHALLEALGTAPAADEEARSLRDKANVALGLAAMKDGRHAQARAALERVRLSGPQSNKALLGFGWAAAATKDHEAALVPWRELAARDAGDAAVLEARLAVPHALAQLGAQAQALEGYETALASFTDEDTALERSLAQVRSGAFVAALARHDDRDAAEMGWLWQMRSLPDLAHAGHLASVIAGHEFQEAYKTWRDLGFLQRNLDDWAGKLASFDDMLALRRKAYTDKLPGVTTQSRAIDLEAMARRRDALAAEVEHVHATTDVVALADADELALLERITQARRRVAALEGIDARSGTDGTARAPTNAAADATPNATPNASASASTSPSLDAAAARERLRLAEGALHWRLTQAWPDRAWSLRKAMAAIERDLEQARTREAALAQAQRDEPARMAALAQRLEQLSARVKTLIPQVAALREQQQQATQAVATRALEGQQARLAGYVRQARFAIAQLYDQAAVAGRADDGKATR